MLDFKEVILNFKVENITHKKKLHLIIYFKTENFERKKEENFQDLPLISYINTKKNFIVRKNSPIFLQKFPRRNFISFCTDKTVSTKSVVLPENDLAIFQVRQAYSICSFISVFLYPATQKVAGYYVIPSDRLSVHLSVCPSVCHKIVSAFENRSRYFHETLFKY